MEVTKTNFQELLPEIKEAINKSDFISIDCELTGLNTRYDINAYDTQQQYYQKVRKSSKDFLAIQYGLCIFRYNKNLRVFKQQAYNFYIFPRPINKHVPDHRFLCQASSIDFLINQGFDFNKLFKEGIPYLNSNEEEKYRKSLTEQQKTRANQLQNSFSPQNDKSNNIISMNITEKIFVDDVFKQIEAFIVSDEEERILPKCNAYVRRLIYQEAQNCLGNRASLETRLLDNKDRVLVVTRVKDRKIKEEEEKKRIEAEEEELTTCIGFSEVIKALVSSGKLIVGHNMCLDLLHTIDKFITNLPEEYEEFKEIANCSFSNLLDTKYMSNAEPFKQLVNSSVLSHLFKTISEKPFSIPSVDIEENAQGYKLENNKEHEAGYDAFITGLSFLAMWKHLGTLEESDDDPFSNVSLIEPYINRLFLMRLQDAPYIHLGGKDPIPSRENVLYVTFPKEWKLNDIIQLFSPFGNVHVAWIDDHSAYVGLHKREQTAVALSTLSQSDTYNVISYAKRQAQLVGHNYLPISPTLPIRRKKTIENSSFALTKKRRTASFGEASSSKRKRSIDPIEEDPEDIGMPVLTLEPAIKPIATTKKSFYENSEWD